MGQKIHPGGLRVGVIHDWKSNWYAGKKEIAGYILEDVKIREHIYKKLAHAGLSDILIRKDKQRITVDIYTARPEIVIGKSGVEVDALRRELHALTQKNVHININEIKRPELDAKLVAQSIAEQLSNRVAFRRAMKRALASAIRSGAAGVKIQCSGRLGGGEMSRREQYSEGRVPLHTIRADIDYGFVEAKTTAGRIGVKVWINKGEIMPEGFGDTDTRLGDQDTRRRRGGRGRGPGGGGGRPRRDQQAERPRTEEPKVESPETTDTPMPEQAVETPPTEAPEAAAPAPAEPAAEKPKRTRKPKAAEPKAEEKSEPKAEEKPEPKAEEKPEGGDA